VFGQSIRLWVTLHLQCRELPGLMASTKYTACVAAEDSSENRTPFPAALPFISADASPPKLAARVLWNSVRGFKALGTCEATFEFTANEPVIVSFVTLDASEPASTWLPGAANQPGGAGPAAWQEVGNVSSALAPVQAVTSMAARPGTAPAEAAQDAPAAALQEAHEAQWHSALQPLALQLASGHAPKAPRRLRISTAAGATHSARGLHALLHLTSLPCGTSMRLLAAAVDASGNVGEHAAQTVATLPDISPPLFVDGTPHVTTSHTSQEPSAPHVPAPACIQTLQSTIKKHPACQIHYQIHYQNQHSCTAAPMAAYRLDCSGMCNVCLCNPCLRASHAATRAGNGQQSSPDNVTVSVHIRLSEQALVSCVLLSCLPSTDRGMLEQGCTPSQKLYAISILSEAGPTPQAALSSHDLQAIAVNNSSIVAAQALHTFEFRMPWVRVAVLPAPGSPHLEHCGAHKPQSITHLRTHSTVTG
jgi:hypothetical protein